MEKGVEKNLTKHILINKAGRDDFPAIENILRGTIQNPYGSGNIDESEVEMELKKINKALDSNKFGQILIAKDEQSQTLGFVFFGDPDPRITNFTNSDPDITLELRLLYLDPLKRQQGIGGQLLHQVEDVARNLGKNRIELISGPRYMLIGAGRFYQKQGYRLVGTLPNYFEGKYWGRVFQKDLSA